MRVSAGPLDEIPRDRCVAVAGGEAIVTRAGDSVIAFRNRCLHQASPLAGGWVRDGKLTCPLHFWRYRLPSGELIGQPGRLDSYPVVVVAGEVFVEVPEPQPVLSVREMMLRHAREWRRDAVPEAEKGARSVETVIWDMGGIFRRYFTEVLVDEGKDRGWPLERMPLGPTGPAEDKAYRRMCQGELDEPDYLAGILEILEVEGIEFDPIRDPDWELERRPEVWELIGELAEGTIGQAILTNDATRWLGENWWETWPDRDLFDAIVDVATLGARKPAPEPFRAVLDRLGVEPGRCLFVDDMPVNCRGAEAVGMQSLWFDIMSPAASVSRLRERIGIR